MWCRVVSQGRGVASAWGACGVKQLTGDVLSTLPTRGAVPLVLSQWDEESFSPTKNIAALHGHGRGKGHL